MNNLKKIKNTTFMRQNNIIDKNTTFENKEPTPFIKFKRQNAFIIRDPIFDLTNPKSITFDNNKKKLAIIEKILKENLELNNLRIIDRNKLTIEKERLEEEILQEKARFLKIHDAKKYAKLIAAGFVVGLSLAALA